MALRFSTGLKNALLSKRAEATNLITGTTISFGDGTGSSSRDQILDSGNGLAGFKVGDDITVAGSTLNNVTTPILAVAAGAVEVAAGTLEPEAAGDQVILASARGGSFGDLFRDGVIHVYSGTQPATGDLGETGTLLAIISESSGAFVADAVDNGLSFGDAVAAVLGKATGETWSGTAIAADVAGWARFYDNGYDTGASSTAIRFDGAVAVSGAQFNMSQTDLVVGTPSTIDSVVINMASN